MSRAPLVMSELGKEGRGSEEYKREKRRLRREGREWGIDDESCPAFIQVRKGCTGLSGEARTCQGMEYPGDGIEMNCGGKSGIGWSETHPARNFLYLLPSVPRFELFYSMRVVDYIMFVGTWIGKCIFACTCAKSKCEFEREIKNDIRNCTTQRNWNATREKIPCPPGISQ